jgi:hypothetical protein
LCSQPAASQKHWYCSYHTVEAQLRRGRLRPKRGTAEQRGYGADHQGERARLDPIVQAGEAFCCRCGGRIAPGSEWHLDHKPNRQGWLGPAHAVCNLRASNGGRRAGWAPPAEPPSRYSREW